MFRWIALSCFWVLHVCKLNFSYEFRSMNSYKFNFMNVLRYSYQKSNLFIHNNGIIIHIALFNFIWIQDIKLFLIFSIEFMLWTLNLTHQFRIHSNSKYEFRYLSLFPIWMQMVHELVWLFHLIHYLRIWIHMYNELVYHISAGHEP